MEIRLKRAPPAKDFDIEYRNRVFQVNRILFAAHARHYTGAVLAWHPITPFRVPDGTAPLHSAFELFVRWLNGESVLVTRPLAADLAALAGLLGCQTLVQFVANFGHNTTADIVADLTARAARSLDIDAHAAWLARHISEALWGLVKGGSVGALGKVLAHVGDELDEIVFDTLCEGGDRGLLASLSQYVNILKVPESSITQIFGAARHETATDESACPMVKTFWQRSREVDDTLALVRRCMDTKLGRTSSGVASTDLNVKQS
jgi:hypothetical protein